MTKTGRERRIFLVTIAAKALLGVLQILIAVSLLLGVLDRLPDIVTWIFQRELEEDPSDFLASRIISLVAPLPEFQTSFLVIYFTAHGMLHVAVVGAILSNLRGAHLAAILTLSVFIVYQIFEWLHVGGVMLVVLTLIDLIVIVLTLRDRRQLHAYKI